MTRKKKTEELACAARSDDFTGGNLKSQLNILGEIFVIHVGGKGTTLVAVKTEIMAL